MRRFLISFRMAFCIVVWVSMVVTGEVGEGLGVKKETFWGRVLGLYGLWWKGPGECWRLFLR